jgi:hypothetical protein
VGTPCRSAWICIVHSQSTERRARFLGPAFCSVCEECFSSLPDESDRGYHSSSPHGDHISYHPQESKRTIFTRQQM